MWMRLSCFVFVVIAINFTNGANILALYPMPSKSHFILGMTLLEELAVRGHKITLISPFRDESSNPNPNITFVMIDDGMRKLMEAQKNVNFLELNKNSAFKAVSNVVMIGRELANYTLSHQNVQQILKSDQKFDLFLLDLMVYDSLLGISKYLNIPTVAFSSAGTTRWSDEMTKNPLNPSYNPNMLLPLTDRMSLMERIISTVYNIYEKFLNSFVNFSIQEAIYKEHFEKLMNPLPKLSDLITNVDLVLLNTHPIFQYPRAFVPNVISIGGLHIKPNNKNSIEKKMLERMDSAESVIYLSFGSNAKFSDFSNEEIEIFFQVFSQLENTLVLLKFEDTEKAAQLDPPENIILAKWMPQQEILAHPNVKIFITHGGLLSCMEAVYYGVPIIGIPVFGDQHFNVRRAVQQGYGVRLELRKITANSLTESIDMILNDPRFSDNAKKYSKIFRDNPMRPIDTATFYIEHVLRMKGADHLKSAATKMSWWQIHLIDVGLILTLLLITPVMVLKVLLKLTKSKRTDVKKVNKLTKKTN